MYWRLTLMIGISDILTAVTSFLVFGNHYHGWCIFQAVMQQFAYCSSVLWTACVAHFMHRLIVGRWSCVLGAAEPLRPAEMGTLHRNYQAFAWGVSTLVLLIGLGGPGHSYGKDGNSGWCWLNRPAEQDGWIFIFYAPLWFSLAFIVAVVVRCRRTLNADRKFREAVLGAGSDGMKVELYYHLVGYPLILLTVFLWGTFRRIWQLADEQSAKQNLGYWSSLLHACPYEEATCPYHHHLLLLLLLLLLLILLLLLLRLLLLHLPSHAFSPRCCSSG
jgi:hypothetical protein